MSHYQFSFPPALVLPMPSLLRSAQQERRNRILGYLLLHAVNDVLGRGCVSNAATQFQCLRAMIRRVRVDRADLNSISAGGRPQQWRRDAVVAAVPLHECSSFRSIEASSGLSRSTLARRVGKKDGVRRARASVKPQLTEEHKRRRMESALSFVCRHPLNGDLYFNEMHNRIHIDEKCFFLFKARNKYYLTDKEETPHITAINKSFTTKVMFLVTVARPRFDTRRKPWFDGKIGCWPFIDQVAAKRTSKNRPARAMATTSISVNGNVYERFLISKLLPAVQKRWPGKRSTKIVVQQDNATAHNAALNEQVSTASKATGLKIEFENQPARSPDFNIFDLGFFNAIQALQHRKKTFEIVSLASAIEEAFAELEGAKIDKCFMTLQSVMHETMLCEGGNKYKVPHLKKEKLLRLGTLPQRLPCTEKACDVATGALLGESHF